MVGTGEQSFRAKKTGLVSGFSRRDFDVDLVVLSRLH